MNARRKDGTINKYSCIFIYSFFCHMYIIISFQGYLRRGDTKRKLTGQGEGKNRDDKRTHGTISALFFECNRIETSTLDTKFSTRVFGCCREHRNYR